MSNSKKTPVKSRWRLLVLLVVFMPQGLSGTVEALLNRRKGGQ